MTSLLLMGKETPEGIRISASCSVCKRGNRERERWRERERATKSAVIQPGSSCSWVGLLHCLRWVSASPLHLHPLLPTLSHHPTSEVVRSAHVHTHRRINESLHRPCPCLSPVETGDRPPENQVWWAGLRVRWVGPQLLLLPLRFHLARLSSSVSPSLSLPPPPPLPSNDT